MKIIRNLEFQGKQTAVCIGKFDGIHRGHRLLIEQPHNAMTPSDYSLNRQKKKTNRLL